MTMANAKNQDLFDTLRNSGLRKRVARTITDASKKADGRVPAPARKALDDLRSLVGELEHRIGGTAADRRKAGAAKAARTRKAKAAKRSQAAKKAAKTRARTRA
jgi:hypothetical protein